MKRITSLVLCLAMLFAMAATATAAAVGFENAKQSTLGSTINGVFAEKKTEKQAYHYNMQKPGKLTIDMQSEMSVLQVYVYDAKGQKLWDKALRADSKTKKISAVNSIYLCAGDYYVEVTNGSQVGNYAMTVKADYVGETYPEEQGGVNNATNVATLAELNKQYDGCIALNDNTDVYKVIMGESGKVTLDMYSNIPSVRVEFVGEFGLKAWNKVIDADKSTGSVKVSEVMYLTQGIYYFTVSSNTSYGAYNFKCNFETAAESYGETFNNNNNGISTASIIGTNYKYLGQIAMGNDVDIYRIDLKQANPTFILNTKMTNIQIKLLDKQGKEILNFAEKQNPSTKEIMCNKKFEIQPGTYYISLSGSNSYGNYSFYLTNGGTVVTDPVVKVMVNGMRVVFTQPPVIESGRTLVPLRGIFEALDAEVKWDAATQTVTASKFGYEIVLRIGSNKLYVNNVAKTLDVPAKIINGSTVVPARAISESFKCKVDWDPKTRTVIINEQY